MDESTSACPGCGIVLARSVGPTHAYIGASPACWERYGAVLAREYSQVVPWEIHPLTVDAYAAQHPGRESPRATQSIAVHLMALMLRFEDGIGDARSRLIVLGDAARRAPPGVHWLEPPRPLGPPTIQGILDRDPDEHVEAVTLWGRAVYAAWAPHHATVRGWLTEITARRATR